MGLRDHTFDKMVARKPVGPPLSTNGQPPASDPPYPATPIDSSKIPASVNSIYSPDLYTSPAFNLVDVNEARTRPRRDSDVSSHGTWDTDDDEQEGTPEEKDIPKPLRITPSKQNLSQKAEEHAPAQEELPASLRPGPADATSRQSRKSLEDQRHEQGVQANPWANETSQHTNPPEQRFESNNPYTKARSSPSAPPPPPPQDFSQAPVELPTVYTPAEEVSKLSLGGPKSPERSYETAESFKVPQVGQNPLNRISEASEPVSLAENPWESHAPPLKRQPTAQEKWDDAGSFAPPPGPPPFQHPPPSDNMKPSPVQPASSSHAEDSRPTQPPRAAPGPISISGQPQESRSTESAPETPGARARQQRGEHYQIKHINWFDASHSSDPRIKPAMRRSPILTQNANGPCPLLALVNALVLSTPQNIDTALVETLRSREQVSLGLLLDAVFDELMSGRRGDAAADLPDVSELYSFLLALHTGMNVNPRFVTPATTPRGSFDGHPPDMNGVHPLHRAQSKPGVFEETREMRLYSTFGIPLVHGWVAPRGTQAYDAFERAAQTFEEAQNIQFAESELEDKLRTEGLSGSEQQTLQDVQTIKQFFANWPTQLTDYGLDTLSRNLRPGQIAILFRNDHFSTVYKEPKHGALMTLVTDAGYSGHDEVVWESLVDVSGAASEMFSGDFRVVSHGEDTRLNQGNSAGGEEGWTTVQGRNQQPFERNETRQSPLRVSNAPATQSHSPPPLPGPRPTSQQTGIVSSRHDDAALFPPPTDEQRRASEQEDHDLALALQLQEEEEERHRQAEAQRRREQELSEQFLSNEGERPPAIPPRRQSQMPSSAPATTSGGRPAVNRPTDQPNDPTAPPSYEQSASDRPYREAGSTAPPQQGNPLNAYDALRRQQQPGGSPSYTPSGPSRGGRRASGGLPRRTSQPGGVPPGAYPGQTGAGRGGRPLHAQSQSHGGPATAQQAEEKCVVM